MFKNLIKLTAIASCLWVSFSSCDKKLECEDAICTMMFTSHQVRIQDASGQVPALDKVEVHVGSDYSYSATQSSSDPYYYTIADDTWLTSVGKNVSRYTEVWIYRQGNIVSKVPFEFKTDCCHIEYVSGTNTIVIP